MANERAEFEFSVSGKVLYRGCYDPALCPIKPWYVAFEADRDSINGNGETLEKAIQAALMNGEGAFIEMISECRNARRFFDTDK